MIITNLKESPQFKEQTLNLIEKSFEYSNENSFAIDFYPLMSEKNSHNCYIIVEDNLVKAHIGVLNKDIFLNKELFSFSMYGGIAVLETERGKGLFKKLFKYVLEKNDSACLHLLWSDQLEMYEKFNFYPAIEQFEYHQDLEDAIDYHPINFSQLSEKKINELMSIYNNQDDLRLQRNLKDWKELQKISSSQLYIKEEDGLISNYFFMNKGEDLNGVIIEAGSFKDYNELKKYGILWSPTPLGTDYDTLYATVLRIGDPESFKQFIKSYTKDKIKILNLESESIQFIFEGNNFNLELHEFITGVFGPNRFEELNNLQPIYISGLDSI